MFRMTRILSTLYIYTLYFNIDKLILLSSWREEKIALLAFVYSRKLQRSRSYRIYTTLTRVDVPLATTCLLWERNGSHQAILDIASLFP